MGHYMKQCGAISRYKEASEMVLSLKRADGYK